MKDSFTKIYLELTKKEKTVVLLAMKDFHSDYPNIYMGQLSFLKTANVKFAIKELLHYSKTCEDEKIKPPVRSKIVQSILNKIDQPNIDRTIYLDELQVKSKAYKTFDKNIYIAYVPICNGNMTGRCFLTSDIKKNKFTVTAKLSQMTEIIQQLTFKFGLWN